MKVIMLTGDFEKGKTATLVLVHEILVAYGAKISFFKRFGAKEERDFSSTLEYKEKIIRVFTAGDVDNKQGENALREELSDTKYDFLICACNNTGKNKFFRRATHRIRKTVAETIACRFAANWYDANKIVERLDKSIK